MSKNKKKSANPWSGENWPRMDKKTKKVRGEHGLHKSDVFSFDGYLAGVIAQGVKELRKQHKRQGGNPGPLSPKEWQTVLKHIEEGMQIYALHSVIEGEADKAKFKRALSLLAEYWDCLWY